LRHFVRQFVQLRIAGDPYRHSFLTQQILNGDQARGCVHGIDGAHDIAEDAGNNFFCRKFRAIRDAVAARAQLVAGFDFLQ
jgi:hypothetical protein